MAVNPIGMYVASVGERNSVVPDADDVTVAVQRWIAANAKIKRYKT